MKRRDTKREARSPSTKLGAGKEQEARRFYHVSCFLHLASPFIVLLASCLLPLVSSSVMAAKASVGTPTRAIQDLDDKLDDYKTGALPPADEEFNRSLKKEILHGTFNIRELSRLALGKHWTPLTEKERNDFVQLMTDLLENRAILSKEQGKKKAKSQNVYTVSYRGDKLLNPEKTRALTRTSVFVKSEDIRVSIDYKLKKEADEWKIFDVILDGASLLDNYKYQFDSIIKKGGFQDLVGRMQRKLTSIRNEKK
ncbi:MAG: hypothetical protein COV46_08560 [Deltaproteobacteria bacterium CG11_big_fil_rev_8_21_14_0_20_49_13]|nr:MAG: hypothetical protein COV46_08560 [Deltaproteobacteria bacterium CG11_big_fil_rev_8_21_14_0_20_49_13]